MTKARVAELLGIVIVGAILWWLLRTPPHKAVVGDVLLGDPTVTASVGSTQAGSQDYYTSSTPGDLN